MGHAHGLSIEDQRAADKKIGTTGFWVLLVVTFAEVGVALYAKAFLPGVLVRLVMIAMSLFKAYYIVSIFMHLGHEVGGMALTIVMPMTLLIWGVIAFLWEGDHARQSRNYVRDARPGVEAKTTEKPEQTSMKSANELSTQVSFL
jgi:cytochrome c oxidase subunit 4